MVHKKITGILHLLIPVFLFLGCVKKPEKAPPSEEIYGNFLPGKELRIAFSEPPFSGISFYLPPNALSEPATIRLYIPKTTEPVFLMAGLKPLSPVVGLEPLNIQYLSEGTLTLPVLPTTSPASGIIRTTSLSLLPAGLWNLIPFSFPPPDTFSTVNIPLVQNGIYAFVTYWDKREIFEKGTLTGERCPSLTEDEKNCQEGACQTFGCLSTFCGISSPDEPSLCLPTPRWEERTGCVCSCIQGRCLWVR